MSSRPSAHGGNGSKLDCNGMGGAVITGCTRWTQGASRASLQGAVTGFAAKRSNWRAYGRAGHRRRRHRRSGAPQTSLVRISRISAQAAGANPWQGRGARCLCAPSGLNSLDCAALRLAARLSRRFGLLLRRLHGQLTPLRLRSGRGGPADVRHGHSIRERVSQRTPPSAAHPLPTRALTQRGRRRRTSFLTARARRASSRSAASCMRACGTRPTSPTVGSSGHAVAVCT